MDETNQIYYDNDEKEDGEFGIPVIPVFPFPEMLDYEFLIMSLKPDDAKIVLIRHFELRGKEAAKAAGFSSEWSFYRRDHAFQKMMNRKKEEFLGYN